MFNLGPAVLAAAVVLAATGANAGDTLRPLCTDRPGKGTAPCTVDAGHFQVEIDAFDAAFQHSSGVTTDIYSALDPTLKYGLSDDFDLEASLAPYVEVRTRDVAGRSRTASGIGDLFLRAKWNVLSGDGLAMALVPFVKIPTASKEIGNEAVEEGIVVPLSLGLDGDWSLFSTPELDARKNALGGGYHMAAVDVAGASRTFEGGITVAAEAWTSQDFDTRTTRQYSVDMDVAWQPAAEPDTQWDGGINIGLNSATPDLQLYAGVSERF